MVAAWATGSLPLAPRALANGRLPQVTSVSQGFGVPTGTTRLIVPATFGAIVSDDGGQSWQLVCEDPLGLANSPIDATIRTSSVGIWVVASTNGVLYSRDGGCNFTKAGGSLTNASATDVAISPADPMRVVVTTNTPGVPNGVHLSQDGGAAFSGPNPAMPNQIFRNVRFAGSDGHRLYALGYDATGAQTLTALYRSDDGGATFRSNPYTTMGLSAPELIGADPRDANRVYFQGRANGTSMLYRSIDGGLSFDVNPNDIGPIFAGAFGSDGTLYLATSTGVTSSLDGISFGAPPANAPKITCLAEVAGALYGCSTDEINTGFSLGRSTDGRTWTSIFKLGQNIVGPLYCPPDSQVRTQCCAKWPTFAMQNMLPASPATCMGPGPMPPPPPGSGCGCDMGARRTWEGLAAAVALATLVSAVRRGRSRSRRRPGQSRSS